VLGGGLALVLVNNGRLVLLLRGRVAAPPGQRPAVGRRQADSEGVATVGHWPGCWSLFGRHQAAGGLVTSSVSRVTGEGCRTAGESLTPCVWQNHLKVCFSRSYRRILDKARMHKHTHKHTVLNIKFKLKLLQIKWHVSEFLRKRSSLTIVTHSSS
jgi:hypothetical protein